MPLLGSEEAGQGSIELAAGPDSPGGGGGGGSGVQTVTSPDQVVQVSPSVGNVVVTQHAVATWGSAGSVRYFAVDGTNGVDAVGRGFSDVSQAAAGTNACKTIGFLLQILPRQGNGRIARVAIRAGNYASDTIVDFSGYRGYNRFLVIGTDTIASAGAVAFAGDANDTIAAGMTTATGMNAAGYNPTAYSVAADGTPTITAQLAGGGLPAFPVTSAVPAAQPYGARLRFDVNTTTAALRNKCFSVIMVPTSSTLIVGLPLGTNPVASDVFYLEMANVTGPTTTLMHGGGDLNATVRLQFCGLNLGIITGGHCSPRFAGCEVSFISGNNLSIDCSATISAVPSGTQTIGLGLRHGGISVFGGVHNLTDIADTGATAATFFQEPEFFLWERGAGPGMIVYGGAHALGTNIAEQIGTNSSTVHGATCQIWAPQNRSSAAGVKTCGLAMYGGYSLGRIKFSNMGANPCACIGGAGLGVRIQAISGAAADGNTDVGLDLSPAGVSGNTLGAQGCTIALVATPSATGTAGDVRLANGTITTWTALLATGLTDQEGNRFVSATGPLATVKSFSGVIITSAGGATHGFLTDVGISAVAITGNEPNAIQYPTSARLITRLRGGAPAGTGAQAPTFTLYKNGVATAMTVTLPTGAPAGTNRVDSAHPILFADGDTFDVRVDFDATSEGNQPVCATLEGPC